MRLRLLASICLRNAVGSFDSLFSMKDLRPKGKVVVAARDILPGELVLEEKEPLLYYPFKQNEIIYDGVPQDYTSVFGLYAVAKQISQPNLQKILRLFGAVDGQRAEFFRGIGRKYMECLPWKIDLDLLVKVNMVVKLNSFDGEDGCYIFEKLSRFSHSCTANCHYQIKDDTCRCVAVKTVKAGEELTITYNANRDFDSTHERRFELLFFYDFTCHCPRCDAPGDDTRQFNCVDSACNGVMMACQPISKRIPRFTDILYTGVEYVEPHLLPCTVCHRAAPADYQTEMLALESELPALAKHLEGMLYRCMGATSPVEKAEFLLDEIANCNLPRRHMLVKPILSIKLVLLDLIHRQRGEEVVKRKRRAAFECIELVQNVFPYPPYAHRVLKEVISIVCQLCGSQSPRPVLSLQEEKGLLQKALRVHLIIYGRDSRLYKEEKVLADVVSKLPHQHHNTKMCAFCEESPLYAAIQLRHYPQRADVVYCSDGCRQSHARVR